MSIKTNFGKLLEPPESWIWHFGYLTMANLGRKNGDAVESPLIKVQSADGREFVWVLRLYFWGKADNGADCNEASVQLISLNNHQVWTKFRFNFRIDGCTKSEYDTGPRGELFRRWGDERGQDHIPTNTWLSSSCVFIPSISFDIYDIKCKPDKEQRAWIYGNRCQPIQGVPLPIPASDNDRSTVENEINSKNCESSAKSRSKTNDDESESRQDDVSLKFIQDPKFGDIQIEVQGKKFRAHRILLSSQSKVLAEILGDDETDEKKSISIDDISDRVFIEILRFIYLQEVRGIENNAKDFFATAVKYSMHSFKKICEKTLSKKVTTENAMEYLELADHFVLEELRKHVVEFMASNFTTIAENSSISSLKDMKSNSLFGLIQAMATKLSEK